MSRFTSNYSIHPFEATDTGDWCWAVAEPLIWEVRDAAGNVTDEIVAEQGFCTDLGTIPRWARWLINPADPQCVRGWILHDKLLELWGPERQIEAAGVAYQALKACRVPAWSRMLQVAAIIARIDVW